MGKADLSGEAMRIIITLVSALIALTLLWVFHEKIFTFLRDTILPGIWEMLFKNIICKIFGHWLFRVGATILGAKLGAIIGSIFLPGIGTVIGAGLGAAGGFNLPGIIC